MPLNIKVLHRLLDKKRTRERHKALLEAIEAKKAGKEWDESGFKELL